MALSEEEVTYVAATESQRDANAQTMENAARGLMRQKAEMEKHIADNQAVHDKVYGTDAGAGKALDAEIAANGKAVTAIFASGVTRQTKADMEAEIEAGNTPPGF